MKRKKQMRYRRKKAPKSLAREEKFQFSLAIPPAIAKLLTLVGGILALTSAIFFAFGYIALTTHLNLLGVNSLIEVPNEDYVRTGGQMFLFIPLF